MYKIGKIFLFALQNFVHNAWLSLINLHIIVITLFSVNMMIALNYVRTSALLSLENWVDITVSLKKNVTPDDVSRLAAEIDTYPEVASIDIRTPEQNLEAFKQNNPDLNATILPSLD